MDYLEYLSTDHWKHVAHDAKVRANWECAVCTAREHLEAHHRTYARLGQEQPGDVVVLCSKCHRRLHGTFEECAERQLLLPYIPRGVELN